MSSGLESIMKPRYVVQRIRATGIWYGPTHYSDSTCAVTLCGKEIDDKWWIELVRGTMTASPDCSKCNELAKEWP